VNAEECPELTTLKTETRMFAITVAGNACSKKSRHRLGDFSCYGLHVFTNRHCRFLIE